MKLPASVKATRDRYVTLFVVPQIPPYSSTTIDDALRKWVIRLGQQVRFDTHDPHWGCKRADPGRPVSKDSIAFLEGAVLHMWDLLSEAASGHGTITPDPDSLDVPIYPAPNGQTFEAVDPFNWLSVLDPPDPPVFMGKTLADYFTFRDTLRRIYREELKRDVIADPDAIVNWLFHWREAGHDEVWIRARIRESDEWKAGH